MTGTRTDVLVLGMRRIAMLLLMACLAATFLASSALAEDEYDDPAATSPGTTWMVQPSGPEGPNDRSYFVYGVDPGQRVDDSVRIANISETDLTLGLLATDAFNVPESGAFDLLPTAEQPVDVGSWVTLPVDSVTIPASSSVDVPFAVEVPPNATPGEQVHRPWSATEPWSTVRSLPQ